jgi:uncharacterized protein
MLLLPVRKRYTVTEQSIHVEVIFGAAPRQLRSVQLKVAFGSSVAQAVSRSGLMALLNAQEIDALQLAVWGCKVQPSYQLRDKDRIELCRPLKVDPKVARRERFQRQGSKSAGLFNKLRNGAKAGY